MPPLKKEYKLTFHGLLIKMKNKKYHIVGTVPKSNKKIVEIGTAINSGRAKLDL